jgi:amino acid transporter
VKDEPLKPNPQRHELRQNSVSFFGALAMSAAFMGPGVSIFYNIVPAAAVAGAAFPLSFLVSMIAILFVAASVVAFSRKIQSASFAFAYTSAGLGPKFGFMAGWIALLAYAMSAPLTYAGFGIMVSEFMQRQFAVQVSWIWFFVAVGVVVSLLSCFGVSHSTRTTLVFLVLEVGVMLALFGSVIFGGGQNSVQPFMYHSAPHGLSSIGAGMVFGILSFTGFEAAANLGEETRNAARNVPVAIALSVILIGVFYIVGSYVADIAFHLEAADIANNGAPLDVICRRFWGNNWAWVVDLTVLNSVFANAIAGQMSMVRNLFSLGRARMLPGFLGRTNRFGAPFNAVLFDFGLSMVLGLSVGCWIGAWGVWKLMGAIMSIGLILVYALVSAALPFFFLSKHRDEFSRLKHVWVPLICMVLLLLPLYGTIWPVPIFPYNLAPYVVVLWILIGSYRLASRQRAGDFAAGFGSSLSE